MKWWGHFFRLYDTAAEIIPKKIVLEPDPLRTTFGFPGCLLAPTKLLKLQSSFRFPWLHLSSGATVNTFFKFYRNYIIHKIQYPYFCKYYFTLVHIGAELRAVADFNYSIASAQMYLLDNCLLQFPISCKKSAHFSRSSLINFLKNDTYMLLFMCRAYICVLLRAGLNV